MNSLLAPGHHLGKAEVLLMLKFRFNLSFPVLAGGFRGEQAGGRVVLVAPSLCFFFFFKVWNNRASMCWMLLCLLLQDVSWCFPLTKASQWLLSGYNSSLLWPLLLLWMTICSCWFSMPSKYWLPIHTLTVLLQIVLRKKQWNTTRCNIATTSKARMSAWLLNPSYYIAGLCGGVDRLFSWAPICWAVWCGLILRNS